MLPASREQPGLVSAPGGEALYRHAIRAWTTLDMDPRDIHQVGLDELAMIDDERREIARAEGFGDDVAAYRLALATDPANQAPTPEALVARATEDIERAAAVAPTVFGRLPRAGCEVRPVEAFKEQNAPFAYYFPPAVDGSRPGTYYVNTYDLPSRTYSKLGSTTYHEAIPGHHFQISAGDGAPEPQRLPAARCAARGRRLRGGLGPLLGAARGRAGPVPERGRAVRDAGRRRRGAPRGSSWTPACTGWAGRGSSRWTGCWRPACPTRTRTSRPTATSPGRARRSRYMTGMREIRRLRRELEARDGDRFDLKRFHDELLGHGSLPLATLARELPLWVTPAA